MSRWIFLTLLLTASPSWAQATGSVRIVGTVQEMVSVRFHSDSTSGAGVQGSNTASSNSDLDYTLDLGNVSVVPGRDNGIRGGRVDLILRANTSYVLTASVQGQGFGTHPDEFRLSDIGFGLPSSSITASGARARSEGTLVMDSRFDSDPLGAPVANGAAAFTATLQDLEGGVPVLRGERISYGGSLNSPNNGLVVSTRYAVVPQYFRGDTRFEATIVYTISSP
ncbi:MAG: hypothetical protein M3Y59_17800 [Myxococcota bacterium]|nr:hypothetical protein [Myxococcota bacterium]